MSSQPVLVFDSGVGGLSIIQALRERLPSQPLAYACDNAAFPYGTKSAAWLIERVEQVMAPFIEAVQPVLLVIACNTASTLVLDRLRQHYPLLPIVGVVPAIKPAATMTRTGVIALLATQGTIERPYTLDLINTFAHDCEVIRLSASPLVELAEQALAGQSIADQVLIDILRPLFTIKRLDTIVLGCTHFPLIQAQLDQVARQHERHWQWIDSGAAIARRVLHLLSKNMTLAHSLASMTCMSTPPASIQPISSALIPTWMTATLPSHSHLPLSLMRLGLDPQPRLISLPLHSLGSI